MTKIGKENTYRFIFLPQNPVEGSFILFRFLLRRGKFFYSGPPRPYILFLQKLPLMGNIFKNKFLEYWESIGDYKSLWYQTHELTIDFTKDFFEKNANKLGKIVGYLNKIFSTSKFEVFLKRRISEQIFRLLNVLHPARNNGKKSTVLLNDDELNRYVVERFNRQYANYIEIRFFNTFTNILLLFVYWAWFIKELLKRGISWRKERPHFKLLVEACSGFHKKVLRDDILIDGKFFTKDDILFCQFNNMSPKINNRFRAVKEKGFHTFSAVNLAVSIRHNFFEMLYLYFILP